jgi:hypothetical protein
LHLLNSTEHEEERRRLGARKIKSSYPLLILSVPLHSALFVMQNSNELLFITVFIVVFLYLSIAVLGRGPLCEKVLGKAIPWQPPGE